MAVTIVGSATGIATVTIPAHNPGDLLLAFAFRDGATGMTTPSTWTSQALGSATSTGAGTYSKWSDGTITSVTSTNATGMIVLILRGALALGQVTTATYGTGTTNTITHPALASPLNYNGKNMVIRFIGHRSVDQNIQTSVPTGFTLATSYLDGVNHLAAFTAENVASASSFGFTGTGTASGWIAATISVATVPYNDFYQITATDDDGRESGGVWSSSGTVAQGNNFNIGVRIPSVTRPSGKVLSSAYLVFQDGANPNGTKPDGALSVENAVNGAILSGTHRPGTMTAFATPTASWSGSGTAGWVIDCTDALNDYMATTAWVSGNSLVFFGPPTTAGSAGATFIGANSATTNGIQFNRIRLMLNWVDPPPTGASLAKVYTGGTWKTCVVKVYTGGTWVTKTLKSYKSGSWY